MFVISCRLKHSVISTYFMQTSIPARMVVAGKHMLIIMMKTMRHLDL